MHLLARADGIAFLEKCRERRPGAFRELILQLKKGGLDPAYFAAKYGTDIVQHFAPQWASLRDEGYLAQADASAVKLSREGLGRVDSLLPRFFLPEHVNIRYT